MNMTAALSQTDETSERLAFLRLDDAARADTQ